MLEPANLTPLPQTHTGQSLSQEWGTYSVGDAGPWDIPGHSAHFRRSLWNAGLAGEPLRCATHLDLAAGQFEFEVWVNHLAAKAPLDSGSMVMLVRARGIGRHCPVGKTLRVVCILGEYPLVPVTIAYGHISVTRG